MKFIKYRTILAVLLMTTALPWTINCAAVTTVKKIHRPIHKPVRKMASSSVCKIVRVKTAKGYRSTRVCKVAANDPLLKSPINQNALNQPASAAPELKARTVPDRAYAVDGETFFHEGRKFRVQGVPPGSLAIGSEHAKQKLQMALDSGAITVEPISVDDSGVALALVKVNGRNVADLIGATQ